MRVSSKLQSRVVVVVVYLLVYFFMFSVSVYVSLLCNVNKVVFPVVCVVSIYPHRLLAFSQNVRPGEGSVPTGPTTGKLQSLMTSRAEKGTQDLMR